LAQKLGIGADSALVLVGAPEDLHLALPAGVRVRRQVRGHADVVVAFFADMSRVAERIEALGNVVLPAGGLWIVWPKRSSGVVTDVTDDGVRSAALPLGLVDNKVCAIDDTWTALRLVWRRERRG
jgi:hypothetical protein